MQKVFKTIQRQALYNARNSAMQPSRALVSAPQYYFATGKQSKVITVQARISSSELRPEH